MCWHPCLVESDSERTRLLLTNAAYFHLKHLDVSKHTRNLSPASRAILLSGPAGNTLIASRICIFLYISYPVLAFPSFAEPYHQTLAKALAYQFDAKLLLLDVANFSLKVRSSPRDLFFLACFLICYLLVFVNQPQIQSKFGTINKETVSTCFIYQINFMIIDRWCWWTLVLFIKRVDTWRWS